MERASPDVCGTGWEYEKCGHMWVREYGYSLDGDDIHDIGYCYEGPHDEPHDDESEPVSED